MEGGSTLIRKFVRVLAGHHSKQWSNIERWQSVLIKTEWRVGSILVRKFVRVLAGTTQCTTVSMSIERWQSVLIKTEWRLVVYL